MTVSMMSNALLKSNVNVIVNSKQMFCQVITIRLQSEDTCKMLFLLLQIQQQGYRGTALHVILKRAIMSSQPQI